MINNFFFFINKIFYNNFKNNKIIKKLELNLINNDFGIKITYNIIKNIEKFKNKKSKILLYIKKYFYNLFLIKKKTINFNKQISLKKNKFPYIFFFLGINGTGKTTSIIKLTFFLNNKYKNKKLLIVSKDILKYSYLKNKNIFIFLFKKKNNIKHIICESIKYAKKKKINFIFIDNSKNLNKDLLNELKKNQKIIYKKCLIENILILDTLIEKIQIIKKQIKKIKNFININSIIITKFDLYNNYGLIVNIYKIFKIPIKFIIYGKNIENINILNKKKIIKNICKILF